MNESEETWAMALMLITIAAGIATAGFTLGHSSGYKYGQIQCVLGSVDYKLEKQADNTTEWVYNESN